MFCSLQSPQPSDWSDSECGGNYVFGRDQSSTGGALVGYITPIPQIACKLLQRSYGLFTVRCASGGSVCRNTDLQKNLVAILSRFFFFFSMIGYARKRAGSTSCKHMTLPVLIYTTSDVVQDFHQYQEDETTWIILKYPELRGHLLTAWMRNWVAIKLIFDPVEPVQVSREFFGRHDYIYTEFIALCGTILPAYILALWTGCGLNSQCLRELNFKEELDMNMVGLLL